MKTIPDNKNTSPSYILHSHLFDYITTVETNAKTPPNAARAYFLFGVLVWNAYAVLDSRFSFLDGFSSPRIRITNMDNQTTVWKIFYILFYTVWTEIRSSLYPSLPSMTNPSPRIRLAIQSRFTSAVRSYLQQRQTDGHINTTPFSFANQGKYIEANSGNLQNLSTHLAYPDQWAPLDTIVGGQSKKQSPLHPFYGQVRNFFSSSDWTKIDTIAADFYPSTTLFQEQLEELVEVNSSLSAEEKMKAEVWAGFESDRATPPGKSMILLCLLLAAKNYGVKEAVSLLCGSSVCLFHAGVAAWKIKYDYMQPRPIQMIRENYLNIDIVSPNDGVTRNGGLWLPYQPVSLYTPPFPDYISGHSTFTMSFSTFMNLALGSDMIPIQGCTIDPKYFKLFSAVFDQMNEPVLFSNIALKPDSSLVVNDTPTIPIEFKWETWSYIAREAGMSRIYGGIHWENSNAGGLAVGQAIAPILMSKLNWSNLSLKFD